VTDEVIARLHRCLVDELRRQGHPPDRPLTVGRIYEDLVPYRAVRSRLGVELNADYEHALLRLLAGEGGFLRVEPEAVRADLQREVAEAYPAVGLFRQYSESDVWVDLPAGPGTMPDPDPVGPSEASAVVRAAAAPIADPLPPPIAEGAGESAMAPSACGFCQAVLPAGRRVHFCPACGTDQRLRPCARCDAALQREWRYCIDCGHEQPTD
jgi:predicted RNA-binding Zn-ribbon protein involved in translation (DUF1610 family)